MVDRFTISYCDKESFYCLFVIAVAEKIGKRGLVVWSGPGQRWDQLLSANLRLARAEKLPDLHKSSVRRSMQMHLKEERAGGKNEKRRGTFHFPGCALSYSYLATGDMNDGGDWWYSPRCPSPQITGRQLLQQKRRGAQGASKPLWKGTVAEIWRTLERTSSWLRPSSQRLRDMIMPCNLQYEVFFQDKIATVNKKCSFEEEEGCLTKGLLKSPWRDISPRFGTGRLRIQGLPISSSLYLAFKLAHTFLRSFPTIFHGKHWWHHIHWELGGWWDGQHNANRYHVPRTSPMESSGRVGMARVQIYTRHNMYVGCRRGGWCRFIVSSGTGRTNGRWALQARDFFFFLCSRLSQISSF